MSLQYNVISATCKGPQVEHIYQDHLRVVETQTCLLAVVADGLGAVTSSARGSELICMILSEMAAIVCWEVHDFPEMLNTAVSEWYRRLESKNIDPRNCCTTCSAVVINKLERIAYLCQIGDSPIFWRSDHKKMETMCTEKDFLNETICLGTSQKPTFIVNTRKFEGAFDFMVASDGFGDEVIPEIADAMFDYFINKYKKVRPKHRNSALKQELLTTIQKINNDDKSLIFGWIC